MLKIELMEKLFKGYKDFHEMKPEEYLSPTDLHSNILEDKIEFSVDSLEVIAEELKEAGYLEQRTEGKAGSIFVTYKYKKNPKGKINRINLMIIELEALEKLREVFKKNKLSNLAELSHCAAIVKNIHDIRLADKNTELLTLIAKNIQNITRNRG